MQELKQTYNNYSPVSVSLATIIVFIMNLDTMLKKMCYIDFLPKPHEYVKSVSHCGPDLNEMIIELSTLIPQLSDFISQFNNIVTQNGVNVVTDSTGSMAIDVPADMSDPVADSISRRIGIIDRLITTHGNSINDIFQKGLGIERELKANNPNYVSQLSDHITEFKRLNSSYKH